MLPRVNWPVLLRCAPGFVARRKFPETLVRRFRAAAFELSSDATAAFELDGELAGRLPGEVFRGAGKIAGRLLNRWPRLRFGAAAFALRPFA